MKHTRTAVLALVLTALFSAFASAQGSGPSPSFILIPPPAPAAGPFAPGTCNVNTDVYPYLHSVDVYVGGLEFSFEETTTTLQGEEVLSRILQQFANASTYLTKCGFTQASFLVEPGILATPDDIVNIYAIAPAIGFIDPLVTYLPSLTPAQQKAQLGFIAFSYQFWYSIIAGYGDFPLQVDYTTCPAGKICVHPDTLQQRPATPGKAPFPVN